MNILIIKLGALGDVVMATPLIEAIRDAHPNATIHLLTSAPFAPIFAAWPRIKVTVYPRRGVGSMLRTLRWIRRLECARIYDLQSNDRSALLCACSGSPLRIGNHTRFPYTHHPRERWYGQCHIFDRMCEVLAAAEIDDVGSVPSLPATAAEREAVADWLRHHTLAERGFVLLHATASATRPEKRWPHFGALGQRLSALGLTPVWIGAGADSEENRRLASASGGIDASGAFTIAALAEAARHARFAVTNDSGPMHVLSAASIPVFGLFGPSDWRRNHALGQRECVIACVETVDEFRGAKTGDCLAQIPCDLVWERLGAAGLL